MWWVAALRAVVVVVVAVADGVGGEGERMSGVRESGAVFDDGAVLIGNATDIRLGPGWSGRAYVGEVDVSAMFQEIIAEARELQANGDGDPTTGAHSSKHRLTEATAPASTSGTTAATPATTAFCDGTSVATLDCRGNCLRGGARYQVASLGVCEAVEVVNCCCEEFHKLARVHGSVAVRSDVTRLWFGDVKEIGGSVVVSADDFGKRELASMHLGGVLRIGGGIDATRTALTSIDFGSSLTSVGGDLNFYNNKRLRSINFGNLTTVGGSLDLSITGLSSIAFGSLKKIDGSLDLGFSNLVGVDFGNLTSIGGDLDLANSLALTSVGFGNITRVGGDLDLSSSYGLKRIDFENLTSVGGKLDLSKNGRLFSIGFSRPIAVGGKVNACGNLALRQVECGGHLSAECICADPWVSLVACPVRCQDKHCDC